MQHQPTSTFAPARDLISDPASVGAVPPARHWNMAAALARLVALPWRFLQARRQLLVLGGMSDRELADIGLLRQDLHDAVSLPVSVTPTSLFQRRVAERRLARERLVKQERRVTALTS